MKESKERIGLVEYPTTHVSEGCVSMRRVVTNVAEYVKSPPLEY